MTGAAHPQHNHDGAVFLRSPSLFFLIFLTSSGGVCAFTAPIILPKYHHPPPSLKFRPGSTRLFSNTSTKPKTDFSGQTARDEEPTNEGLSDIDAKVLQTLLDENPDVATRENLEKILRRDAESKQEQHRQKKKSVTPADDQKFASKTLQKLGGWGAFQPKLNELFESASLFLKNRIERDSKLIATLGVFALDRAFKDTSRVLPAVATVVRKTEVGKNLLKPSQNEDLDLRQAEDEIKSVSESIQDILSGESSTGTPRRVLRSVSSASGNKARSASIARKRKPKIPNPVGKAVDLTYEMQYEMKGEDAGYKTKEIRKNLKAVGEGSVRLLNSGKRAAIGLLSATKIKDRFFLTSQSSSDEKAKSSSNKDSENIIREYTPSEELAIQNKYLANTLQTCIASPAQTWLKDGLTLNNQLAYKEALDFMKASLDTLQQNDDNVISSQEGENKLKTLQNMRESVIDMTYRTNGKKASRSMRKLLNEPLDVQMKQLNENASSNNAREAINKSKSTTEKGYADNAKQAEVLDAAVVKDTNFESKQNLQEAYINMPYYDMSKKPSHENKSSSWFFSKESTSTVTPSIIPEVLNAEVISSLEISPTAASVSVIDEEENRVMVEVISSEYDDVFSANENFKKAEVFSEEDEFDVDIKDNAVVGAGLRALDIIFVVVEIILTGIPTIIIASSRFSSRLEQSKRNGLGYEGWKKLENIQDAARRY